MKARIITSLMALAALLAASCAKESGQKETAPLPQVPISVEASVSGLTKAVTNGLQTSFEANDQLTLYAWTGSNAAVPEKKVVSGVVNTFDGTKWTPASTMLWKNVYDAHYFLGISPARTVTSFTADAVSSSEDLLVATILGDGIVAPQTVTAPPVALEFSHLMAWLNVNVKYRNQWGGVPEAVVTTAAATVGTIDYLTKTITPGTVATQTLAAATTAAEGYDATYTALCIPQGISTINFTIAGQTLVYTHSEDIVLEAGKVTTLSLLVGKDKIALDDNTVSAWGDGEVNPDMGAASGILADATRPLTIKAKENGTKVGFTNKSAGTVTWITSDGRSGTISAGSSYNIPLDAGQRVWFIGDGTNNAFSNGTEAGSSHISMDKDAEVYGNIMSLLDDDFATATTLPGNNTFANLFKGEEHLKNNPAEGILLPAKTLTEGCYKGMFNGCTGLEQVEVGATDMSAAGSMDGWLDGSSVSSEGIVSADPTIWTMGENLPWGATVYAKGENGPEAVYTAPSALPNALTYNTTAQTLVTAGVVHKAGAVVLEYSTNGTSWSTDVAKGTNAGNYNVYCRVKDSGNSSAALPVSIAAKTVTNPTITLATTVYTYNGSAKTPTVSSVKDGNATIASSEYTVSYSNNINAGSSAKVTISDKSGGNYKVSGSKTFTINKAAGSISYSTTSVNKAHTDANFTNSLTKTGDGTVTYSSSNTNVATVNTSGVVDVKNPGTTTIKATVADGSNYTYATKTATYTVNVSYYVSFSYNGNVQTWSVPVTGTYELEAWGGAGGGRVNDPGGAGGYAKGRVSLTKGETIYIVCGGMGSGPTVYESDTNPQSGPFIGGYNGGGDGGKGKGKYSGAAGGGGATHIAKNWFVIGKNDTNSYDGKSYLIIAGGGGGRGHGISQAGAGGGTSGGRGTKVKSAEPVSAAEYGSGYNNGENSYGADGMKGYEGNCSAEGTGGGGGGYRGGNAYSAPSIEVIVSPNFRSASGCGGSSASGSGVTNFSTSAGQNTGNGRAKITFIQ